MAQTDSSATASNDSITSDKGDLELLTERVYLAFKAFRTGVYGFDEVIPDSVRGASVAEARKEGWIVDIWLENEKQINPVLFRGKELIIESYPHLNVIPADSVLSIEIMDIGTGLSGLHGISSKGIVIKLKE